MISSTHQELLQTTVQAAGQLFRDPVADDVGNSDHLETLKAWRQVETLVLGIHPRPSPAYIKTIIDKMEIIKRDCGRYSIFGSYMHALLSDVLRHLEALNHVS